MAESKDQSVKKIIELYFTKWDVLDSLKMHLSGGRQLTKKELEIVLERANHPEKENSDSSELSSSESSEEFERKNLQLVQTESACKVNNLNDSDSDVSEAEFALEVSQIEVIEEIFKCLKHLNILNPIANFIEKNPGEEMQPKFILDLMNEHREEIGGSTFRESDKSTGIENPEQCNITQRSNITSMQEESCSAKQEPSCSTRAPWEGLCGIFQGGMLAEKDLVECMILDNPNADTDLSSEFEWE